MESNPKERPGEPMPDIEDTNGLREWMATNIHRPPAGYDAIKHPDGSPFTQEEQINTYIGQTLDVIEFHKGRGSLNKDARNSITRSIESMTKREAE